MLKKLKKKLYPVFKIGFDKYMAKPRKFTYEDITVIISEDVFPPKFTISTQLLLDFIKPLNLSNEKFLELGCGSGIIALFAASKGANVVASDINNTAVELLKEASVANNIPLIVVHSDLFENLQEYNFDYIIINPPYYPKTPKNDKERAWFCGENFEYFRKLFQQLSSHLAINTWMILSEDCDIAQIKSIALKHQLILESIFTRKVKQEKNYIFQIKKTE